MLIPSYVLLWILAAIACVLVGRELGKWLFGKNETLLAKKRAAQVLAIELRAQGLKLLPALLEDFAVGDVNDLLQRIADVAKLVQAGSDAIKRELESTYENVLAVKLSTPEGLALIKAKIAVAEQATPALVPQPAQAPAQSPAPAPVQAQPAAA
jgi:hypothetical protein